MKYKIEMIAIFLFLRVTISWVSLHAQLVTYKVKSLIKLYIFLTFFKNFLSQKLRNENNQLFSSRF